MKSALYRGIVVHQRVRPRRHRLRYALSWMLFDLDELPELHRSLRFFSYNGRNLLGFRDSDHLDGSNRPLRMQIEAILTQAGLAPDGGRIGVLCMPRVLGSVFNPIAVWFCHRRDGSLSAMLYEVNNTFGQRHCYLIPTPNNDPAATTVQYCGYWHSPRGKKTCEKTNAGGKWRGELHLTRFPQLSLIL